MAAWCIAGVASTAVVGGAQPGERKAMRRIDVALQGVAFRSDAAAVQRGRYLYASRGCAFIAMLRTGQRPDGSALSPVMPFNAPKQINHIGAQALYLHLKNLPPVAAGRR